MVTNYDLDNFADTNKKADAKGEKKPLMSVPLSRKNRTKKQFRFWSIGEGLDFVFLLAIAGVLIIGLIMMFSASYPYA